MPVVKKVAGPVLVANQNDDGSWFVTAPGNEVVPFVTASQLPGGGVAADYGGVRTVGGLIPTGNDDAALVQQYVNDMAASKLPAMFSGGDFIIGSPMVWRSRAVIEKWGNKGVGLNVQGAGAGNTRFLWSVPLSNTSNCITINSPDSSGIARRNYLTKISGMSLLRAPGGVEIAGGTTDGNGIYAGPSTAGEVFHTAKFSDMFFDGFAYPTTISDATLCHFDFCWWAEFLVAIRFGYNIDICKINHSMFGSEQFSTPRNGAIAIQSGVFNDGFNTPFGENVIDINHVWFMKIGKAFEGNATDVNGVRFNNCYFEEVRQYFHHVGTTSGQSQVTFRDCRMNKVASNDTTQNDPLVAGYMAKIQMDGDPAVTGGKIPVVTMEGNIADAAPANAWISFNNRNGRINWTNNDMSPSATYGHLRCIRTSYLAQRSLPVVGTKSGTYTFGNADSGGLALLSGDEIVLASTLTSGSTFTMNNMDANVFQLTLPDGDVTLNVGTLYNSSSKCRVILLAPATVTGTRTITFGSKILGCGASISMTSANQNQVIVFELAGSKASGNVLRNISGPLAWT